MSELKMPTINQVAVSGRLVQDPEFRITEHGSARLSARLACNRSYRDRSGQWQEEASFFNILVWQKLAEHYADRLKKGSPWENGYIESFNGKLRDELLNGEIFTTLTEAKVLTELWRREYNQVRPHSALGYKPPAPEAALRPRIAATS